MAKAQAKKKVLPAKTKVVSFKLTPEQYAMIVERAERRGLRVGPWIRRIVLQAANAPTNGSFLRIHEPDGATT